MSTAFLAGKVFEGHESQHGHPERPARVAAIEEAVRAAGLWPQLHHAQFAAATEAQLFFCHTPRVVETVRRLAQQGGGSIDGDTFVTPDSFDVAAAAAGAALAAVDYVLDGEVNNVFVCTRPPGHHAERDQSMGFCLFNNIALAARHAQVRHGLQRVAILDWDVHHGNGTQQIFYDDPSVLFCSAHQSPLYPGSGSRAEQGEGEGLGTTLNRPLAAGSTGAAYREVWHEFEEAVAAFEPQLILVSAGFDAHSLDPLGGMELTTHDFAELARRTRQLAQSVCSGRMVCVLEGGYNLQGLAESAVAVIGELLSAA